MKIVITGGHFTPAHSVIKKLNGHEVVVIGRKYAFENDTNETYEYKVCKMEGIPFIAINTGRLQRNFSLGSVPSILKFPKGIVASMKILRKVRPDVVVTFGGYVGLPVCLAASLLKIPIVLHEQTQKAGLSARLIGKIADVVCVSFESSLPFFKGKKVVITGNPLREEIFEKQKKPFSYDRPLIYVTGGSAGSHAINECVKDILPRLLEDFVVVHQAGNSREFNDFERLKVFKNSMSPNVRERYIVREFFKTEEVMYFLQNAHLVVSRSGINTVLELMATGCVGILIPLPIGQKNEQKDNARLFESTGLGKMIEQKNLTGEVLYRTIHAMIREIESYRKNSKSAGRYIYPDAADKIVEQIKLHGRKRKSEKGSQDSSRDAKSISF